MEKQRIEILDQLQTLETGDPLGPEEAAAISHLKKRYNNAVETIYQNTPGLFWDIIEVFPEEIWIQIIQHALPTYQYPAALLTLTMVSSKWLQVLTSTPILWANVEIRGSDEDSLATVGIFTHLSCEAPLAVTIYLPFGHDAATLLPMLATVGGRIQRIALATDKRIHGHGYLRFLPAETYRAGTDFLIDTVKHTPNVSVIEIAPAGYRLEQVGPEHVDEAMKLATKLLSPHLRVIHGFCFCRRELLDHTIHLQELYTCEDLNGLVPSLEKVPQLRRLTLLGTAATANKPRELIKAFKGLSNLTSLSLEGHFHLNWLDLLTAVAPDLVNLKLNIPLPQFPAIINILQSCIKLRTLSLHIHVQVDAVSEIAPVSVLGLMNLRSLDFVGLVSEYAEANEIRRIQLEQLSSAITSITELSREVQEASFSLNFTNDDRFKRHVLECITKLPNLDRLSFHGIGEPTALNEPHVTLKRLEELYTSFPRAFDTPNLLAAMGRPGISDLSSMPGYDNLRTLHIDDYVDPQSIRFPQDSLPHLMKLMMRLHGRDQHLQLGSFLLLTSISLGTMPAGATSLCIALLYKPEDCPYLRDIEFLRSSPEWDILFIMLERRNFLTNYSTSRIRRISLPFISCGLRAPLARLLRGIYGNRPSNKDLSFEGVVNLVFDKQISGCLGCVRNMVPCNEPFQTLDGRMDPWPLDLSIYSTVNNPPPLDLDSAIVDWINRREMYALSWKSAAEDSGMQWMRRAVCDKQEDARVEITEHDVPVEG